MKNLKELSRFSASGKTFFFNTGEAENGSPYLAVNALYGRGRQQRLVLFPDHFILFHQNFMKAVEALTGFTVPTAVQEKSDYSALEIPKDCPACHAGSGAFEIGAFGGTEWVISCDSCGHTILDNRTRT